MRRILFACVANALRSQMAEGLARHYARPGTVEVRSGGLRPAGYVHPSALRTLREVGIDIRDQWSKPLDLDFAAKADAVVTLCGPLDEACPASIARGALDWTLPDPSVGGDAAVRRARDEIARRVRELYQEWGVLRDGVDA